MAESYSLICWGGKTGKSVSVSASTDYVTLTSHGVQAGNALPLVFSAGTLPSVAGAALALNTTYYAKYISTSTFELYYDEALTSKIDFTSTGSALYMRSAYLVTSVDTTRYGGITSADYVNSRIFDGIGSWVSGQGPNENVLDDAVIEFADSFDELRSAVLNISTTAYSCTLTTKIDGVRTSAFHNRSFSKGYCLKSNSTQGVVYSATGNCTFDGIRVEYYGTYVSAAWAIAQSSAGYGTKVRNCLVDFTSTGASYGISLTLNEVCNCVVRGQINSATYPAFYASGSAPGSFIYNNLAFGNAVGFKAANISSGWYFNNISIGNTVNWDFRPSYTMAKMYNNAGDVNDVVTVTATAASSTLTFSAPHNRSVNQPIFFRTTGSLPTVGGVPLVAGQMYYVKAVPTTTTMTLSLTVAGSALTFDGVGTGTHSMSLIWSMADDICEIDYTTPTNVFVDPANGDYRPASLSSPLVDAGADVIYGYGYDCGDAERPSYNNGGAESWDIGPFEFDRGYGNHPASTTVTFYGVVAGSEIHVYDSEDNELVGTESCTANQALTWGVPTNPNVKITIIKRGLRWMKFTYLSEEGPQMIPIFPQPDLGYNNPA